MEFLEKEMNHKISEPLSDVRINCDAESQTVFCDKLDVGRGMVIQVRTGISGDYRLPPVLWSDREL
jgi:hypothetical protein